MNNCEEERLIKLINQNKNSCKICLGPTGPTGPSGESDTIKMGITTTGEPGSKALVIDRGKEHNHIFDFNIPMGPTGPAGPTKIKNAYIITYNTGAYPDGIIVSSGSRLPLTRVELDYDNLVELDTVNNTIRFNQIGYYKISFIVSARVLNQGTFDPKTDFVSLGFRKIDTDNIYVGASKWIYNNEYDLISAQGIVSIENMTNLYELVNISPNTIYLNSPDLNYIKSNSYFTNALVNIVIEYQGR